MTHLKFSQFNIGKVKESKETIKNFTSKKVIKDLTKTRDLQLKTNTMQEVLIKRSILDQSVKKLLGSDAMSTIELWSKNHYVKMRKNSHMNQAFSKLSRKFKECINRADFDFVIAEENDKGSNIYEESYL